MNEIKKIIEQFLNQKIQFATTSSLAFERCFDMSLAFHWFVQGKGGLNSQLAKACGTIEGHVFQHWVVYFPDYGIIVDWTARQFDEKADMPLMMSKHNFQSQWGAVDWNFSDY